MGFKPTFILLLLSAFLNCASSQGTELRLATQPKGSSLTALGEPYVRCALKYLKQPYTLDRIPWKRAQESTEQGHYDGFFMASKNKTRDKYATLSNEIISIKWLFVTLQQNVIYPTQASFYNLKFSADLGSARHQWLKKLKDNGTITQQIETPSDPASTLKMLLVKRVDVALMNSVTLENLISPLGIDKQILATYLAYKKPTGVYFSHDFIKKSPAFIKRFNHALTECKEIKISH